MGAQQQASSDVDVARAREVPQSLATVVAEFRGAEGTGHVGAAVCTLDVGLQISTPQPALTAVVSVETDYYLNLLVVVMSVCVCMCVCVCVCVCVCTCV